MRRLLVLLGAVALMSAVVIPAWAETAAPAPSDCAAAAEASRAYWQAQAASDPEAAQRELAVAGSLLERVGKQDISAAQRKKYKDLVPAFRDVFVRRCLMKPPPA